MPSRVKGHKLIYEAHFSIQPSGTSRCWICPGEAALALCFRVSAYVSNASSSAGAILGIWSKHKASAMYFLGLLETSSTMT